MKKNTSLLYILLSFVLLSTGSVSFAEDSTSTNDVTDENAAEDDDKKVYVIPTPQASRISALESALKTQRLDHEIDTLDVNGEPFLTLYKPATTRSPQGCVILLHSDNRHPDWPDAVSPLRNDLPEYSWCTISIEVPDIIKRGVPIKVAAEEVESEENTPPSTFELPNQDTVFARIQAAIDKAQSTNVNQFTLLGYNTGAAYALSFMVNNQASSRALMLIDIQAPDTVSQYELAQQIRQVSQPILDYYSKDQHGNELFAAWRQQAANQREQSNGVFIQLDATADRTTGTKSKQRLVQRVRGFLKQNTEQINQRKALPSVNKGLFYENP